MQEFNLCFGKVKKDCLKFIKSQETKADKFKNKERMIKSFLIPLCFWINKKAENRRPYFVGLAGGQGTGKTTTSSLIKIILTRYFKLKVFKISIDDFYKTRKERLSLSNRIHYLLNESKAFIVLPGKIGTLTELFVAWNSNYLYNINKEYDLIPIYLKKDFWKEIIDNLPENMELDKQFINYFESIEDLEEIISKLN